MKSPHKKVKENKLFRNTSRTRKGADVLHEKMVFYSNKARRLLEEIIKALKDNNASAAELLMAYKLLKETDLLAIDCATKLAPYQTPKLESIETKQKIEHRYVLRAPAQFKNTDDWMKAVGANKEDDSTLNNLPPIPSPKPFTIHDAPNSELDELEDEILTRRSIN